MNTLASTFEVSGVPRATEPLPEVRYRQAIDTLLNQSRRNRKQRLQELIGGLERTEADEQGDTKEGLAQIFKEQLHVAKATEARSIEACSRDHGCLVADVLAHPLIVSLHRAFTQHRPLSLS